MTLYRYKNRGRKGTPSTKETNVSFPRHPLCLPRPECRLGSVLSDKDKTKVVKRRSRPVEERRPCTTKVVQVETVETGGSDNQRLVDYYETDVSPGQKQGGELYERRF